MRFFLTACLAFAVFGCTKDEGDSAVSNLKDGADKAASSVAAAGDDAAKAVGDAVDGAAKAAGDAVDGAATAAGDAVAGATAAAGDAGDAIAAKIAEGMAVEVACGRCIYKMEGATGCPLAAKVNGTPMMVDRRRLSALTPRDSALPPSRPRSRGPSKAASSSRAR